MAAAVCLALLSACSKSPGPQESQVAARVNDGEISVHQVQSVLQRQPRLLSAAGEQAAGRVLEVLIDQELAAQAARAAGLDADPGVIQTLEATRRELLARAHHDRVAAKATGPTSDAIDRYYNDHPALFAKRRLYILQETAVEGSDAALESLGRKVPQWTSAEEVARTLRDTGLRHSTRHLAQATEDLPLTLLEPLSRAGIGQSVFFAQAGGARVFTVLYAHHAPVDRRTATDPISRYLTSERQREAVARAMKELRATAKIRYEGQMAAAAAPAPAAAAR